MSSIAYQGFRLSLGILYPAYSSFKAIRSKNVKEYVKWMMYWIVFALYSFVEAFADYILIWFPFYYELKICFVLWLVLPATRGACVLYRKVVHPQLLKRETEIDANISKATDQGYAALITLGSRGFTLASNIVLSTAIKGSAKLSDQLQKSFSLNDLSGDNVDFRPRRRLEAPPSADEEEMENRLLSQQYRLEMASMQSLERIDQEGGGSGGGGSQSDEQNAQNIRRRQIESKLRDVMAGEGPTLGRPLSRSSTLPRKYKTVSREVSSAIPEVSNECAQDSPESSRSPSPSPSSPVSPGAAYSPPVSPSYSSPSPGGSSSPSSSSVLSASVVDSQSSSRDASSQISAMQRLKMNFFSSKKK